MFNPAFDKQDLLRLARQPMPFGKYQGRLLMDLPEDYLLWFVDRGFPAGQLGELMQLALEIRINGLESLLEPLRTAPKQPVARGVSYTFPADPDDLD